MLLSSDFWSFIEKNIDRDPLRLRLKYHGSENADFAITQIECRKKYAKKLYETLQRPQWLFPDAVAGEQCTSDAIADLHASLVSSGDRVVDLTAGLGVDCLHMASKGAAVTAVEINPLKAQILEHNLSQENVNVKCADCRDYIARYDGEKYDAVFIDPARRAADGSRVFSLADCEPDVVEMIPRIREIGRRLIIKMSPMLDISHTASLLPCLEKMIVIGSSTECKELVAVLDFDLCREQYTIEAVTVLSDSVGNDLSFTRDENAGAIPSFAMPSAGYYLYVPYPAIMKAAPFNLLSSMFGMPLLNPNTHLYLSPVIDPNFPAVLHRIDEVLPFASSVLKRLGREYKFLNITSRNFSLSADTLRKKLRVRDGGAIRLFAVTCCDGKEYLILASPLSSK